MMILMMMTFINRGLQWLFNTIRCEYKNRKREKHHKRVSWRTTSVKDHFILQWTFAGGFA
ncbi:unnamed protein product [Prunus armeniaca]